MATIVSNETLGLYGSSLDHWRAGGNSQVGNNGDHVYVNVKTGNLVIQQQDEYLSSLGPDRPILRTYNSQGKLDGDNNDNWRLDVYQRLSQIVRGSAVTKTHGDGAQVRFTYVNAFNGVEHYRSSGGDGAHDTLSYDTATQIWTWTNGTSLINESYDISGNITGRTDTDGNRISYGYNAGGLITQIGDSSGQLTLLDYSGRNLSQIRTLSDGIEQSRVGYQYDGQSRLTGVIVDLSPADNSTADGNTYTTSYTYDGGSNRIASIISGDGTQAHFTYVAVDGDWRVATITDGLGNVSQFQYNRLPAMTANASIASLNADYVLDTITLQDTVNQTTQTNHALDEAALTATETQTTTTRHNRHYQVQSGDSWAGIAQKLYGASSAGAELRVALGNPSLSAGVLLQNLPSSLDDVTSSVSNYSVNSSQLQTTVTETTQTTHRLNASALSTTDTQTTTVRLDRHYEIQSGDTWASIAQILYGSSSAAAELQAALGNPPLTEGAYLNNLANSLADTVASVSNYSLHSDQLQNTVTQTIHTNYDVDSSRLTTTETQTISIEYEANPRRLSEPYSRNRDEDEDEDEEEEEEFEFEDLYYRVRSGDTWESIAQRVYGSANVADELRNEFNNTSLTVGKKLDDFPEDLTDTQIQTVSVPPYYKVRSGDDWPGIASRLFGTTLVADELRSSLGNPSLTVGAQLTGIPGRLTDTQNITVTVAPYYLVNSGDTWSSIGQKLYGTTLVASQLQSAMGNLTLTAGRHLSNPPTQLSHTQTTTTSRALRYEVRSGDTWSGIAQKLYGATSAASELQAALGNPSLNSGIRLTGLPGTLDDVRTQTITVAPYFAVKSGDTWASIAQSLYGSTQVANELRAALGNPNLTVGTRLGGIPSSLTETQTTTVTVSPYYSVRSDDTWSSIAQRLYGSTVVASQLQSALGNPGLDAGVHLNDLPGTLSHTQTATATRGFQYRVQSGDSWSIIAQVLYGTANVADELRTALGAPSLVVGSQLTNLPTSLTDTQTVTVTVAPYYEIQPADTWSSIAQTLYGTANVADELQSILGNPNLAAGARLSNIPTSLTDTQTVTVSVDTYYQVQSGDTWSSIAQTLYGTTGAGAALSDILGNPALSTGTRLTNLPAVLMAPATATANAPFYLVESGDNWYSIAQSVYGTADAGIGLSQLLGDPSLQTGRRLPVPLSLSYTPPNLAYGRTDITDALGQVSSLVYDIVGRLLEVLSPRMDGERASVKYSYDNDGNLSSAIDANGNRTQYQHDALGNILQQQDSLGNTASYTYTATNQIETQTTYRIVDADGEGPQTAGDPQTIRYVYDSEDHLRFKVSASGRVSEFGYADNGNLKRTITYVGQTYPVGGLSSTTILDENQLSGWVESQDKRQTQVTDFSYNIRGQVETTITYSQVDDNGNGVANGTQSVSRFIYDQAGKLLQMSDPRAEATADANDFVTHYSYDGLGRLLTTTDALGHTTATEYDDANNRIITRFANGLTTTSVYNGNGHLISQNHADSSQALGSTSYVYDDAGRLFVTTDPTGFKTYQFYDESGRFIGMVDGTGAVTETRYDAAGNVIETIGYASPLTPAQLDSLTDSGGNSLDVDINTLVSPHAEDRHNRLFYDSANRLKYSLDAAGYVSESIYDGRGQLTASIGYANPPNLGTNPGLVDIETALGLVADVLVDRYSYRYYDDDGLLIAVQDAAAALITYSYNGAGQQTSSIAYATIPNAIDSPTTHADDQHSQNFYDGKGQLVGSLDAQGNFTEFRYDAGGNIVEKTAFYRPANAGASLSAVRPSVHSNDAVTVNTYTALNQLDTVTRKARDSVVTVTSYVYDIAGNLISTSRALGTAEVRTSQARYDSQGRLTAELNGAGSAALGASSTAAQIDQIWSIHGIHHNYDASGRRISTTDQNGLTRYFYYDNNGRPSYRINALGEVSATRYNDFGDIEGTTSYSNRIDTDGLVGGEMTAALAALLTTARDASHDRSTQTFYDLRSAVKQVLNSLGHSTDYAYNAFGELVQQAQQINAAADAITQFQYDKRGLQTQSIHDPSGLRRITASEYDAFGRVIGSTDGNGQQTDYVYDKRGQVIQVVDPLNRNRKTTYDAFARVLTQTDALNNTTTTTYNDANRSVTITTPEGASTTTRHNRHGQAVTFVDGNGHATVYSYDRNGNLKTTTDAENNQTSNHYDNANRKTSSLDANGIRVNFNYDAANRLLRRTVDPDGLNLTTMYSYDGQGRTQTVTDANGIVTQTEYDRRGQVTATILDPGGLNLRTEYNYDGRGKTVTMTEAAATAEARTTQYHYDGIGRRTRTLVDPAGLNLRTEYRYDANDNVISKTEGAGTLDAQKTHYVYDAAGQMRYSVDALGYIDESLYDANGQVIATKRYENINATRLFESVYLHAGQEIDNLQIYDATPTGATIAVVHDSEKGHDVIQLSGGGTENGYRVRSDGMVNWDNQGQRVISWDMKYDETYVVYISVDTDNGHRYLTYLAGSAEPRISNGYAYHYLSSETKAGNWVRVERDLVADLAAVEPNNTIRDVNAFLIRGSGLIDEIKLHGGISVTAMSDFIAAGEQTAVDRFYQYDDDGRLRYSVDAMGYVTQTDYDGNGRVTSVIDYSTALNGTELAGLTASSNIAALISVNAAQDQRSRSLYDALGRLIFSVDALGFVSRTSYDAGGRITAVTQYSKALNAATLADVDANPTNATSIVRDAIVVNTEQDQATQSTYDNAGRIIAETIAAGSSVATTLSYEYDGIGNQISITDASGHVTKQEFDSAGRKVAAIDAENGTTRTNYDALDNIVKVTDAKGNSGYFFHNAQNQVTLQVDPEGYLTETTYDVHGNRETTTRYANRVVGSYNQYSVISILDAAPTGTVPSAYLVRDAAHDQVTTAQYDALNRNTRIVDALNQAQNYAYDGFGNVTRFTDKNGHVTTYAYDGLNRQIRETLPVVATNGQPVANLTKYDAFSNLVQRIEAQDSSEQRVTRYFYNQRNQLVETILPMVLTANSAALVPLGTVSAQSGGTVTIDYQYSHDRYHCNENEEECDEEIDHQSVITVTWPLIEGLGTGALRIDVDHDGDDTSIILPWNSSQHTSSTTWQDDANYSLGDRTVSIFKSVGTEEILLFEFQSGRNNGQVTTLMNPALHIADQPVGSNQIRFTYWPLSNPNDIRELNVNALTGTDFHLPLDHGGQYGFEGTVFTATGEITNHITGTLDVTTGNASVNASNDSNELVAQNVTPHTYNVYDHAGNVVQETDARGFTTYHYYDAGNRRIASVDAERYLHQVIYDSRGNVIEERVYADAIPGSHDLSNDTPNPMVIMGMSATDYRATYHAYNDNNQLIETRTQNLLLFDRHSGQRTAAIVSQQTLDSLGRTVRTIDGNGHSAYIFHDRVGNVIAQVDALGHLTTSEYASAGNLIRQTRFANKLTTSAMSTLSTTSDPASLVNELESTRAASENRTTLYEYDRLNRLVSETVANVDYAKVYLSGSALTEHTGDVTQLFQYDAQGYLLTQVKANGARTDYQYDAIGRTTHEQGARFADHRDTEVRITTTQQYDGVGNVIEQRSLGVGSADQTTEYQYDKRGNVVRETDPMGGIRNFYYDLNGNLIYENSKRTDADGLSKFIDTRYDYDGLNRQVLTEDAKNFVYHARYNAYGEIEAKGLNGQDREYFEYDKAGRLVKTNQGDGVDRASLFDANGNATAELQSADVNLQPLSLDAIVGLSGIQRTESSYDARNQLLSTYQAPISITRENIEITGLTWVDTIADDLAGGRLEFNNSGTVTLDYAYERNDPCSDEDEDCDEEVEHDASIDIRWPVITGLGNGSIRVLAEWLDGDVEGDTDQATLPSNATHFRASNSWQEEDYSDTRVSLYKMVGSEEVLIFQHQSGRSNGRVTTNLKPGLHFQNQSPDANAAEIWLWQGGELENGPPAGSGPIQVPAIVGLTPLAGWFVLDTSSYAAGTYHYEFKTYDTAADGNTLNYIRGAIVLGSIPSELRQEQRQAVPDINLTNQTLPDLQISRSQAYNAFGEVMREIDGKGNVTDFRYDVRGNLTHKIDPQATAYQDNSSNQLQAYANHRATTRYYYDVNGRTVGMQDANSHHGVTELGRNAYYTTQIYNDADLLVAERHYFGAKTHAYDEFGNRKESTNELNHRSGYDYNTRNQLTRITRPSGNSESYTYDESGRRISRTLSPEANVYHTEKTYYDDIGRVNQTVGYGGAKTRFRYIYNATTGGTETVTINADGRSMHDATDYFGRLQEHRDLAGRVSTYSYNEAGWLTQQQSSAGQNIDYSYYEDGSAKQIIDRGVGTITSYEYDDSGNRVFEGYQQLGSPVYFQWSRVTYDALNRIEAVDDPWYDVSYQYDANGNRRHVNATYHDGLNNDVQTQQYWYTYDRLNRFVVSKGELQNSTVVAGQDGIAVTYDAASQRASANNESYRYNIDGLLTQTRIDGKVRAQRDYDDAGNVTLYREFWDNGRILKRNDYTIDADRRVTLDLEKRYNDSGVEVGDSRSTTFNYDSMGNLRYSSADTGSSTINTIYHYDYWDSAKQKEIRTSGTSTTHDPNLTWNDGFSNFTYNVNGHLTEVRDEVANRYLRYSLGHQGKILRREEQQGTAVLRAQRYYYINDVGIGDAGGFGTSRTDYVSLLAQSQAAANAAGESGPGLDRNAIIAQHEIYNSNPNRHSRGVQAPVSSADFDSNYSPINGVYPATTPGSYILQAANIVTHGSGVNVTATLSNVALAVWGDASLWYLIEDANGLTQNSELVANQSLVIPNVVTNIHNNSDTFRPYDTGALLGDVTPTLPDPPPPPIPPQQKSNAFISILIIVVTAVVTAGVGAALGASSLSGFGAFAANAAAAAAGSVAGQAVGIITGQQEGFDWGAVATSALTAGLTKGTGLGSKLSGGLEKIGLGTNVANAVAGNVIGQGVNILAGQQKGFNWRSTAIAGIAAPINARISEGILGTTNDPTKFAADNPISADVVNGLATGVVSEVTRIVVNREGKIDWASVAGNALGDALASALDRSMKASKKAAQARQTDNHSPLPDASPQRSPNRRHDGLASINQAEIVGAQSTALPEPENRRISRGDTLSEIVAEKYGSADRELILRVAKFNGFADAHSITAGDSVVLPELEQLTDIEVSASKLAAYDAKAVQLDANRQAAQTGPATEPTSIFPTGLVTGPGSLFPPGPATGPSVLAPPASSATEDPFFLTGPTTNTIDSYITRGNNDVSTGRFRRGVFDRERLEESKQNNFNAEAKLALLNFGGQEVEYRRTGSTMELADGAITIGPDLTVSTINKGALNFNFADRRFELSGNLGTAAQLVYAHGEYEGGLGKLSGSVGSVAEIGSGGNLKFGMGGPSGVNIDTSADAKIGAALIKATAKAESGNINLFFFNLKLGAEAEGHLVGAGASIKGGIKTLKSRPGVRMYLGAGLTAFVGGKLKGSVELSVNVDNFKKAASLITSYKESAVNSLRRLYN